MHQFCTFRLQFQSIRRRVSRSVRITYCAALTFLIVATMALAEQAPQLPRSVDEPWIDANSRLKLTCNIAEFWNGAEKDRLEAISKLHPFVLTSWLDAGEAQTGLRVGEVARICVSDEPTGGWVVVVQTTDAVDAASVREKALPDSKESSQLGRDYFEGTGLALHQADGRTLVFAIPAEAFGQVAPRLNEAAHQAVDQEGGPESTTAIVELSFLPARLFDFGPLRNVKVEPAVQGALSAHHMTVRFEPGEDLTVRIGASFPTDADAESGVKSLKHILGQLEAYLELCEKNMPAAVKRFATERPEAKELGPLLDQAIKAARQGLDMAIYQRDGDEVTVIANIASTQPAADAVLLFSLMPRGRR